MRGAGATAATGAEGGGGENRGDGSRPGGEGGQRSSAVLEGNCRQRSAWRLDRRVGEAEGRRSIVRRVSTRDVLARVFRSSHGIKVYLFI